MFLTWTKLHHWEILCDVQRVSTFCLCCAFQIFSSSRVIISSRLRPPQVSSHAWGVCLTGLQHWLPLCFWSESPTCPRSRQDLSYRGLLPSLIFCQSTQFPQARSQPWSLDIYPIKHLFYPLLPALPHQISSSVLVDPEAKPPKCNKDTRCSLFHFFLLQ